MLNFVIIKNMLNVLIVDRQRAVRNQLGERLNFEGYRTVTAENSEEYSKLGAEPRFDIVLCDSVEAGIATGVPFVVILHESSVELALAAMRAGAYDALTVPIDMNEVLAALRRFAVQTEESSSREPLRPIARKAHHHSHIDPIVGDSPSIRYVKHLIDRVAPSEARVLVVGPNGTGKELVARWLHEKSNRRSEPFVEVNCAAIPSELIESELFGHEKGAFTSAIKQRRGKFEQANGGTLFMDEIGDMSLSAQAKVLRALQENKISRVGSDKDLDVNVRVVAATNKNLREEIARGRFREDLYHRLSVIVIAVPPLAERVDDIPQLVTYFVDKICEEYSIPIKGVEQEALRHLERMPWTGNIRELRNVMERLIILSGDVITAEDVCKYVENPVFV